MATWFRRLVHALRGSGADADLREEMEAHRALRQEQLEREGMTPVEAVRASRRALGNVTLAQDDVRDVWIVRWLDALAQDVRHGLRMLVKYPGVTATALVSLALGIGANTAVFSVINTVLLKPLPFRDADRLVMIWSEPPGHPEQRNRATAPEVVAWQTHTTLFDGIGTQFLQQRTISADDNSGQAEVVLVQMLEPSLITALGVRPQLGRTFRADEARVGAPAPIALLSDRLWTERYARDRGVIGRTVQLNGIPTILVGIMPAGFAYLSDGQVDLFVPFTFNPPQLRGSARAFAVGARLKAGVTLTQAQAELDAVARQVESELPPASKGWRPRAQPLHEATYGDLRPALLLMQGVVGFVLLIACGNVAGLLMARSSSRRTELAVRAAIGAGCARIARQLLTESVVLTLAGGAGALAVAWILLRVLTTAGFSLLQGLPVVAIDGRVLAFTLAVAVATGLVFGSVPSIRGARQGVAGAGALTASSRGTTDGAARQRLRAALVVGQIGLASVLLVGSGLLIGSFIRLRANDLGADPKQVIRFAVPFSGDHYLRQTGFYKGTPLVDVSPMVGQSIDRILERVRALPGVQSAGGSSVAPFVGAGPLIDFDIEGRPAPPDGTKQALAAAFQLVTPGFFETMRMPMARGRAFDTRDIAAAPWTMVINEAMARQFWPGADPIGERVVLDLAPDEQPREIIGIVRDVPATPYDQEIRPALYILHSQQAPHTRGPLGTIMRNQMSFLLRVPGPAAPVIADVRATVSALAPDLPIANVRPVEADVAGVLEPSQYSMQVLAVCAGVAMLLAAIGIYGVMSFGVGQRTREIGVRMALGATRGQVLNLIMRQVVFLIATGLLIGFAGAVLLARVMSSTLTTLLWRVKATDLPTYATVALVMAGVALLAGWLPARRAMRVAPTTALRCE